MNEHNSLKNVDNLSAMIKDISESPIWDLRITLETN